MTEIKPYMCSCCNDIWSRENQKSIKLGKYELHLCPDCYHEYIISNNKVLDKIRAEIDQKQYDFMDDKDYDEGIRFGLMLTYQIIDKYRSERLRNEKA